MRRLGTLLFVLGYAGLGAWMLWPWWWQWLIGLGLAVVVMIADRILVALWLFPYEQLSLQFQFLVKSRQFHQAFLLLWSRGDEQTKLLHLSAGFAVVLLVLAMYLLSSAGSMLAIGAVMGLSLKLVLTIVRDWHQPERMSGWLGWQIKRQLGLKEVRWMAGGFVVFWGLLSYWLFF